MRKNLFIFTDPGVDDGIAILELLERLPNYYNVIIFPVAGNCTKEQSFVNAQTLAFNYDNVRVVDNVNIETLNVDTAVEWAGYDGMGDCLEPMELGYDRIIPLTRIEEITGWVDELIMDVLILSPCGIIPQFLSIYKDTNLIDNIIQMGGSLTTLDGEFEFNESLDTVAFGKTVALANQYAYNYAVIPFENCEHLFLDYNRCERPFLRLRSMNSRRLLDTSKRLMYERDGHTTSYLYIYDLYAIVYFLQCIGVKSHSTFMTVRDTICPNYVTSKVNIIKVIDHFC